MRSIRALVSAKEWVFMKAGIVSPPLFFRHASYQERLKKVNYKKYRQLVEFRAAARAEWQTVTAGFNDAISRHYDNIYANEDAEQ